MFTHSHTFIFSHLFYSAIPNHLYYHPYSFSNSIITHTDIFTLYTLTNSCTQLQQPKVHTTNHSNLPYLTITVSHIFDTHIRTHTHSQGKTHRMKHYRTLQAGLSGESPGTNYLRENRGDS